MNTMKIVFIGMLDFSYHCLEVILKNNGNVVGIVTSENVNNNSDYCDLTPLAEKYKIPIHYFKKSINETSVYNWLKEKKPDVIFCLGISQIIKQKILSIATKGVIGAHPSELPKNRGRHPLIWALALGLKESALTFFEMDSGVDSGPVISRIMFEIKKMDDVNAVYQKIKKIAVKQIPEVLNKLRSNNYDLKVQDETRANYWRKRTEKDGIIDWRMNSEAILNLIRALTKPYIGAKFNYKNKKVFVWKAEIYNYNVGKNIEPGKIIKLVGNLPVIKCYDAAIVLKEFEPEIKFLIGDYIL